MSGNLPDIYTGTAFNAEPFDASGVPVWVDLSVRYVGTGTATRGRDQYELDQSQTATADMTWLDQDEYLNPTNPASPYYPNVVPYRPLLWRVMWPVGGTGNLMDGAGLDGSFESYTVPNTPSWFAPLLNLAGAAPAAGLPFLVSSGAWQGTKAAQIVVAGAATTKPAGCSFPVPLIPGRQYTAQVHINQTAATAFQLAIGNQTIAVDPYTRSTSNGWGTPPPIFGFGPTWTTAGGAAADYSTAAGFAFMSHPSVNVRHTVLTQPLGANQLVYDSDQWCTISCPVVATGQAIQASLYARYVSSTTNYAALLSWNTDNTLTVTAQKEVGGVFTTIGSNTTIPDPYAAGDSYRVHLRVVGPDIWVKVWKVNTPVIEPVAWTLQVSDNAIVAPGKLGPTSLVTTGNTNTLPVVLSFSDYRAIGSVVDTTAGVTSTSGSYQLLTQTFTASQPSHTFTVEVQGAPTGANTILVDGIQIEPGATANAFTTAGPVVRSPWTRGFIERFPMQWKEGSRGYFGVLSTPIVGPFFQLASATLHAEYRGAAMVKSPRYYWPLDETSNTATAFSDQSGNGGTSLYRYDAVEGPVSTFSPGASSGIAGDPNGVGVEIGPYTLSAPFTGTILTAGQAGLGQQLSGLGGVGLSWGVTIAFWMSSPSTTFTTLGGLMVGLGSDTVANPAAYTLTFSTVDAGGNQGPSLTYGNNVGAAVTPRPSGTFSGIDGSPHLYVGTLNFSGNSMTLATYYDGTLIGTTSVTVNTTFGTFTPSSLFKQIQIAGFVASTGSSSSIGMGIYGTYEHIALYPRALSTVEIADLVAAGKGYPNENSGTRVARYVALAGLTSQTDIMPGLTTMGVSTLTEGTAALEACQGVQDTEFGNLYEFQEGIAFRGRQARYLSTVASFVFGERVDLGEYPYEEGIAFDDDATYVWNNALLARTGGSVAFATDPTGRSQMRYGTRTFTRTVNGNNDLETQDLANYVVANSKDARPRLAALTFNPAAVRGVTASPDGTLWRMLLKLEPGTRIKVNRRPLAANGGAGMTMSSDYFVEGITPGEVDEVNGTFKVVLLMSPAPITSQPWILEDSLYGQLDVTTILGA